MHDTLTVCETFISIQGESGYAGYPCFFIRLTGCNLRCTYCDTTYAYNEGRERSIDDVLIEAERAGIGLVEITGGEPLLQEGTEALARRLIDSGFELLIETNGSVDISGVDERAVIILDIKTPGSGMSDRMDFENLKRLRPQDEVKFVVTSGEDYRWAVEVINEYCLEQRRVLLSPAMGYVRPEELSRWMIADKLGARLNLQIHKYIFGDERGV
ncbi:MAG: radical SAM protein [Nitrospirae bacterium]|nr:MAG: radical SAM protein [Nitrospirota bacterium]